MKEEQMLQLYLFLTLVLNGDKWSLLCHSCSTHCKWGWVGPSWYKQFWRREKTL